MAITSVNDLWGKKWVIAENPTEMTGDSYDVDLKFNVVPSPIMHVMNYHYNYCNHVDFYSHETTGVVLRFMRNSTYISAYSQLSDYPENTNMHTIRKGSGWEGAEGVTPRLIEFINQPSGYSFEENSHIVAWWNTNCTEVDEVTFDTPQEYAKIFEDIATSIKNKTGKNYLLTPSLMSAEIETISGSEASGTITITTNGTHNVAAYATAEVNVAGEGGITPEGTLNITSNGDHDVTNYATASVNVPNVIPDGYIIPAGTLEITANGSYDAAEYASVNVAVEGSGGDTSIEDALIEGTLTTYTNDRVTKIGAYTFYYHPTLTSISGANVETIEKYGLSNAQKLTTVNFPKLKSIGATAFSRAALASFESDTVTSIESSAFTYSQVETVNLPNITKIPANAFDRCPNLKSISAPQVKVIEQYAFYQCPLTSVSFPVVTDLYQYAFYGNAALESVDMSNLKTITGSETFRGCKKLKKAIFKNLSSLGYNGNVFLGCESLETVDLGTVSSLPSSCLSGCYSLKTIVLRRTINTGNITTMSSTSVLSNCYHFQGKVNATYNPDGLKDGCIYVPDDLVDTYKAASNWSTFADCIKPLSEYVEE